MKIKLLFAFSVFSMLVSCRVNEPEYDANFLIPMAKTVIKVEQITTLENIGYKDSIFFSSSPFAGFVGVLPDTTIPSLGPLLFIDYDDNFVAAVSDTCEIKLIIENFFPFNIKAGTKITIRNYDTSMVNPNNDTVFVGEIKNDIPRQGKGEVSIFIPTPTVRFLNDLEMFFSHFRTGGTFGFPLQPGGYIKVEFRIIVIRAKEVEIEPQKLYTLGDTSDFSFQGAGDASKFNNGILSLYIKNGLPVSFNMQGYFLAEDRVTVLDSLFSFSNVMDSAATIGPDGLVVLGTVREAVIRTQWNEDKFTRLKSAKYLATTGKFLVSERPTPGNIFLKHDDQVVMQLVGRFNVLINQ